MGRINGEFVIFPTVSELEESDFNLVVAGSDDAIVMVEGEMKEVSEDDVVAAIVHALVEDVPGVFNVAADDVMPLRRILGLAAKFPIPILDPLSFIGKDLLGMAGGPIRRYLPIETDYLRYPWVGDLTRMLEEMGFTPLYTAEEALREFAGRDQAKNGRGMDVLDEEARLRDFIERRRRARERQVATESEE